MSGRGDGWVALALAAVVFALYLATLCPTFYVGDGGELTAVPWHFGVAHPPGYPLFSLLYGVLAQLLPFGSVAVRMNAITAACAASIPHGRLRSGSLTSSATEQILVTPA